MKKKTKNKLLTASIFACFGLIGEMALAVNQYQPQYEDAKAITYNEEDNIITLESSDITNYDLWYGLVALNNNDTYAEYNINVELSLMTENDYAGSYNFSGFNYEIEDTTHFNANFTGSNDTGFVIHFINEIYENAIIQYNNVEDEIALSEIEYIDIIDDSDEEFFNYFLVYYNSQTPQTQGDSIIGAVTSGLGLTSEVAKEFLTGFTAIFWDATNSKLTMASEFMLVMLGIAIVMAIIKLALMLIKNNTGA